MSSRADFYFIENLHLFYDKNSLNARNNQEPMTMDGAFRQKRWIEKNNLKPESTDRENEDREKYDTLQELLQQLFHSFKGGMSVETLKEMIRKKVKNIKPRQ
jgi:hypothetical protein